MAKAAAPVHKTGSQKKQERRAQRRPQANENRERLPVEWVVVELVDLGEYALVAQHDDDIVAAREQQPQRVERVAFRGA